VGSVPTGTPSRAEKDEKTLRRPLLTVKDGLACCCEVLQGVGEGCVLHAGERGEPEAAASDEVRLAPEHPLPPDDGAPDDLRWEGTHFTRRWEFESTGRTELKPGEVLELGSRDTPRRLGEGRVSHRPLCAHSLQPPGEGRGGHGCLNPPTPP